MTRWMSKTRSALARTGRQLQRVGDDIITGEHRRLMSKSSPRIDGAYAPRIEYSQPVRNSDGAAEKRHNIRLAATRFANRQFAPDKIFSFWHLVGRPSPRRGFLAGRSLVDGELVRDPGGGLCQLAGMLHVLAIKAGLRIVESHAHSRDLYDANTRYAPLGSDAAVAFAFKDLRFENTLEQPVSFGVDVEHDRVTVHLAAPRPVHEYDARFTRHDAELQRFAAAYRCCRESGRSELVRLARYVVARNE